MKFSLSFTALVVAFDSASASFGKPTMLHSGSAAGRNLLRNARRVQENNYGGNYGYYGGQGEQGGEQEAWFLSDYSLKMLSCIAGEQTINYEDGNVESSTVIFRLCPSNICNADNSTSRGCESGYGDFAVGINSFTQAYVESVKDNYNNGMQYYSYTYGEFNVEEYVRECRLFEEEGGEQNQNNYNYGNYAYIGPACTEDGTDIRLASFSDPYCSQESSDSFESTHNGFTLPYNDGGLIPDSCMSCVRMNDKYEYELGEMCQDTYQSASYRCEESMQTTNGYYGPDTRGCNYLSEKVPANTVKTWSWGSSKKTSDEESEVAKSSGNFFSNQPENVKLAEEYIAVLIISGLIGAAFVVFCVRKTVLNKRAQQKLTDDSPTEPKDPSKVLEAVKSGAILMKVKALESFAKLKSAVSKDASTTPPKEDFLEFEDDKASTYEAPVVKNDTVVSC